MLALRVTDGFDGTDHDHADWAEATFRVTGAKPVTVAAPPTPPRWVLGEGLTTVWPVAKDPRLPHADFIEQGGLRVGQVVNYRVDGRARLVDETQRGLARPAQRQKRHV